ncbi:MAG TPA: L-threonine 3-dehydrogenase [Bacteroidales bacterium]|jgi:threonine 3-dehydrogenase|nr:MAG: L-threonine 3-dehydrogenase [Bacteroidetes bacterium ADurb.Bin145]HOU02107.1 L-threonine 3-dehydrogenase [Bacteroidales bacterium]HQG62842.1 L-threonine 3-dehydrogenase [Bacteroidales bacterium]HQK68127.1 L-threonine 3-dehydrogenase [Bacteroidales bacterium]
MKTMKALVKARPERGLWMQEVPVPEPGLNDVIVKIKKSAICGTDLHIYKWDEWSKRTIKTPMVIGHEYMGTIEKMGAGVTNLKLGERVTGEGHLACGHCRNCRRGKEHVCENSIGIGVHIDGSFAEFLKIPACNVIPLDNRITDDWAAIMDPFGNATHTALSFPLLGEDVLITGAGLIGSMAVAIARFAGARFIVASDLSDYRLQIAKKMGATLTVNPSKGEKISDAVKLLKMRGFDIGLEMSGSPAAFVEMISNMYNGSSISLLGILPSGFEVPWSEIIFKAITLKGIYGREMWETWYKMEQMIIGGINLDPVITHRFHIDEFQKGFDIMEEGNCGKVILNWD